MPVTTRKSSTQTLWCLSIGVSRYQDKTFNPLPYSMTDCQGFSQAIQTATAKKFSKQEIVIHHENALAPELAVVRASLNEVVTKASPEDTIIFYFAGHGIPDNHSSQTLLCLADTQRADILNTGLAMQELLEQLANAKASRQLIILDACHSGSLTLRQSLTPNLLKQLQQASNKQSFYALLSCDQDQESYEFSQLEHGLFTYYLIQGLQGEAVDTQGKIEVNGLYKYVYHQTLQYIDKLNLRRRLVNKRKRSRGEDGLYQEQKLQTPKLIVEAVGELVLADNYITNQNYKPLRNAVIIDGYKDSQNTQLISKILINAGNFELKYWHSQVKDLPDVRETIKNSLSSQQTHDNLSTALLYLRGSIESNALSESFVISNDIKLSRSWLRQQLRQSKIAQQILILDIVEDVEKATLQDWVTDLQFEQANQCIIAGASKIENPEEFTQALLTILSRTNQNTNYQAGLSVAQLITGIQEELSKSNIWRDFFLAGIQGVIEVLPDSIAQNSQAVDLGICPYLGLRAFSENDAQYFYGRETLTQQLINEINQNSFLALVGASGSGKSSVVQAGLIANLRHGKLLPTSADWWIKCLRPGENPMLALTQVMLDKGDDSNKSLLEYEGLLHLGGEGFVYWLRRRPEPTVLLVIDQFEELFTLTQQTERQRFLDILLEALEFAQDKFKLIITLRADFIASCLEIPALVQKLQRHSILVPPSLTESDYRKVIEKPAQQVGLKVESGLVELLLQDLQDSSGDLPLLQFVLEQLWEYRNRDACLTIQAYREKIGGIRGALERKAQAVYDNLTESEKDIAQWIFLTLTQLGEGTEDTRRKVSKSALFEGKYPQILVEKTLQKFIEAKLIVVNQDELVKSQSRAVKAPVDLEIESQLELLKAEVTVEVTHEILIRHWSTLRWWLSENRERLYHQQRLERKASEWEQKGKNPDFLLQKVQLTEAEAFVQKYSDYLRPLERAYIKQSINARRNQRLRVSGFVGSAIAVVLGFGIFAWQQQQQSQLAQLIRYATFKTVTPEIRKNILASLPQLLEKAQSNQRNGEISKALDDYRQIIFLSNNLQPSADNHQIKQLSVMSKQAETSLSQIISQTQIPLLEAQLKVGNFGKLETPDFSKFENQYTGALKVTYAILMREQGAKADLDNDGKLNEGEQVFLPCQTLKELEQLWGKYTQNRCSWRLGNEMRIQPKCQELGGQTLTSAIFWPPSVYLVEQRLISCDKI